MTTPMNPETPRPTAFPENQSPTVEFVLVDDEPLHVERWRSETVRFVRVNIPPNSSSLWHQHLKYGVYVATEPINVSEQSYGNAVKPLVKNRGEVFCRDHTKDHLLHIVKTGDQPLFNIEVELLKKKEDVKPHDHVPVREGSGIELLNDELECRVYRLTLDSDVRDVKLILPTEGVFVVMDECKLKVTSALTTGEKIEFDRMFKVGDDFVLPEGEYRLELPGAALSKTSIVLTEVY